MNKVKSNFNTHPTFLLGRDLLTDEVYWLEAPKWACSWYWSIGWVETYNRPLSPNLSKDSNSHSHFNNLISHYDKEGYINITDSKTFDSTLSEAETWVLVELMASAYTLRNAAELLGRGGSHITSNPCKELLIDKEYTSHINRVLLPAIFKQVASLLTPAPAATEVKESL